NETRPRDFCRASAQHTPSRFSVGGSTHGGALHPAASASPGASSLSPALGDVTRGKESVGTAFTFATLVFATAFPAACLGSDLRLGRSEERRVGKECRCRWSPDVYKKKEEMTLR